MVGHDVSCDAVCQFSINWLLQEESCLHCEMIMCRFYLLTMKSSLLNEHSYKHLEFFSYSINVYVLVYMYYRFLGKIIELCLNMTLGLYFWYFTQCVTSLGNLFLPHIFQRHLPRALHKLILVAKLKIQWNLQMYILDGTIYFVIALFHRSLFMMAFFNMNFMYSDNVHLFISLIWPFHTFKEVKTIPWQKLLQLR